MLVLTRGFGRKIIVTAPDGEKLEVMVCGHKNGKSLVGITAPLSYIIEREELIDRAEAAEIVAEALHGRDW